MIRLFLSATACLALLLAVETRAAGSGDHAHGHGHSSEDIGAPGDPSKVDRTIEVKLLDTAFSAREIHVEKGETIRFVLINEGELVHEFNIGTAAMHAAHAAEMEAMVESGMLEADRINHMAGGMAHDDPNSVLLAPGETGEIVWTFSAEAALEFSCNVPGHREAGMVGAFDLGHGH